ncbi:hypothetical protein D1872_305070 [compost metagenome]
MLRRFMHKRKDVAQVPFAIFGALMPVEAVQGKVHLAQRRLAEQLVSRFRQQRSVRRNIHFETLLMGDVQQQIDFGMKQRFAFDMQINVT